MSINLAKKPELHTFEHTDRQGDELSITARHCVLVHIDPQGMGEDESIVLLTNEQAGELAHWLDAKQFANKSSDFGVHATWRVTDHYGDELVVTVAPGETTFEINPAIKDDPYDYWMVECSPEVAEDIAHMILTHLHRTH
jgi:hypothetical protein